MTELHDRQPLSRVELIVLARLPATEGATTTGATTKRSTTKGSMAKGSKTNGATASEIGKSLREIGMQFSNSDLIDSVTAALVSLGAQALVDGPSASIAKPPSKNAKKPAAARFKRTEKGSLALSNSLGMAVAPSWKDMCSRVVPALALGESPGSDAAAIALGSTEAMIATLLRRDRSLGDVASIAGLCDQIIARALGMPPGAVTPAGIRAYALAMHCGVSSKAEFEVIAANFAPPSAARVAKGTKGAKGVKRPTQDAALTSLGQQFAETHFGLMAKAKAASKAAPKLAIIRSLQRRWVSQQDESDDAQRPSNLRSAPVQSPTAAEVPLAGQSAPAASATDAGETLLIAVREAIPMVGSDGRYGRENVFVSALWQQVARDQPQLSLGRFKQWLLAANRNQQLALVRADIVDDMDARLIEESEIEDLGDTFHFVLDRRDSLLAPGSVNYGR